MSAWTGGASPRRYLLVVSLIGLGLAAAPGIFGMFGRAPLGGQMMDEFRPFMTQAKVETFQSYMEEIDAAAGEMRRLPEVMAASGPTEERSFAKLFPSVAKFNQKWPAIFDDMHGGMLATMKDMVDNFKAVDALPPFWMFPWFFVAPGILVAVVASSALRANRRRAPVRGRLILLVVLGIGLIAAPGIFQMFSRAPKGAQMIDEFRPIMTSEKLTTVQGYFLTIAGAEAEVRNEALPTLVERAKPAPRFEAIDGFNADWPRISGDMAPMIGAMADNLDNYAAVDALPPFSLFPWFFVLPGALVVGLGLAAARRRQRGPVFERAPALRVPQRHR